MEKFKKWLGNNWVTVLLCIVALIVAAFIVKPIINFFKGLGSSFDKLGDKNTSTGKVELNTSNLRNNAEFYNNIADRLYEAMKGWGDNLSTIVPLVKNLNGDEIKAVYNSFGTKMYDTTFKTGSLLIGEELTLTGWLSNEYGDSTSRRNIINQFLAKAGMQI